MHRVVKLIFTVLANCFIYIEVFASLGKLSVILPVVATGIPNIKLTRSGRARLGGISFRKRFSILVDGGELIIERGVFFNNNCSINCLNRIVIGSNTIFGEDVKIYDHNHLFDAGVGVSKFSFSTHEVIIGNNCWIGSGVIILKGVHICNNVMIAAGSVVSTNIDEPGVYSFTNPTTPRFIGSAVY